MTRMDTLNTDKPITIEPMRAFPSIRDHLVSDVSWNFRVKTKDQKVQATAPDAPDGTWRMPQRDVDRVQEFAQVHRMLFVARTSATSCATFPQTRGIHQPAFPVRLLPPWKMHPLDTGEPTVRTQAVTRAWILQHQLEIFVPRSRPEHITITDNAIIPVIRTHDSG